MTTKILDIDDCKEIEEVLGRPLNEIELTEVLDVDELPYPVLVVVATLAGRSKTLALKYLREIVPGCRLSQLVTRMETIIQSNRR